MAMEPGAAVLELTPKHDRQTMCTPVRPRPRLPTPTLHPLRLGHWLPSPPPPPTPNPQAQAITLGAGHGAPLPQACGHSSIELVLSNGPATGLPFPPLLSTLWPGFRVQYAPGSAASRQKQARPPPRPPPGSRLWCVTSGVGFGLKCGRKPCRPCFRCGAPPGSGLGLQSRPVPHPPALGPPPATLSQGVHRGPYQGSPLGMYHYFAAHLGVC